MSLNGQGIDVDKSPNSFYLKQTFFGDCLTLTISFVSQFHELLEQILKYIAYLLPLKPHNETYYITKRHVKPQRHKTVFHFLVLLFVIKRLCQQKLTNSTK